METRAWNAAVALALIISGVAVVDAQVKTSFSVRRGKTRISVNPVFPLAPCVCRFSNPTQDPSALSGTPRRFRRRAP